uniref:Uncharacterized protein n=1 Tax=Candidatus Kentrum sp. DK TaxID=2126562 RepID=A0A450SJL4_9GAMM|nr:MAG: hypothetical protein BECKDK2373C_GA0170839_10403 [Candidatus Kentron sp. DK]VFJ57416.1 MAG: hypothetical protein BECKDK2373B_GA0170837_10669 [Candidatus Kentron sp. DK]
MSGASLPGNAAGRLRWGFSCGGVGLLCRMIPYPDDVRAIDALEMTESKAIWKSLSRTLHRFFARFCRAFGHNPDFCITLSKNCLFYHPANLSEE